jgi:hypothetical protein
MEVAAEEDVEDIARAAIDDDLEEEKEKEKDGTNPRCCW